MIDMAAAASLALIGVLWAVCGRRAGPAPVRNRPAPRLPELRRAVVPMRRWLDPVQLRLARTQARLERGEELLGKDLADDIVHGRMPAEDVEAIALTILMHPRVMSVRVEMLRDD